MKNNYAKQKGSFDCLQTSISNLTGIPYRDVPPFERHNPKEYGGVDGFEQGRHIGFLKCMDFLESSGYGTLLVEASRSDSVFCLPKLGAKEYLCLGVLDVSEDEGHAVIVMVCDNDEMWLEHDPAEIEAENLDDLSHLLYIFKGRSL